MYLLVQDSSGRSSFKNTQKLVMRYVCVQKSKSLGRQKTQMQKRQQSFLAKLEMKMDDVAQSLEGLLMYILEQSSMSLLVLNSWLTYI